MAYLLSHEIEVSVLTPAPTRERRHRAPQGQGALGAGNDPGQLRLRTIRRAEPDMGMLVEWVLNITQNRYDAYQRGEPDPYGLPAPENLSLMSDRQGRVEDEQEPELLRRRGSTA
jgi:hypothetical protein